jgi:hypothetical protein
MTEQAIKKRISRARAAAADNLRRAGYGIITTDGGPFSLIAVRYSEARFIRVVSHRAGVGDMKACRSYQVPSNCVREVWEAEMTEGLPTVFDIKRVF